MMMRNIIDGDRFCDAEFSIFWGGWCFKRNLSKEREREVGIEVLNDIYYKLSLSISLMVVCQLLNTVSSIVGRDDKNDIFIKTIVAQLFASRLIALISRSAIHVQLRAIAATDDDYRTELTNVIPPKNTYVM